MVMRKEFKSIFIVSLGITSVILIGAIYSNGREEVIAAENQKDRGEIISYPEVTFSSKFIDKLEDQSDEDNQVKFKVLKNSKREFNPKDDVVPFVTRYNQQLTNEESFSLRILPFRSDSRNSSLYDLETYLLSYVGAGIKTYQRSFQKGDFNIAQIALNMMNSGHENYYSLYTAIKKDSRVYILTTGYYTDESSQNPFELSTSDNMLLYSEAVRSFRFMDNNLQKDKSNKLSREGLNPLVVSLYKEFNSEFENTI